MCHVAMCSSQAMPGRTDYSVQGEACTFCPFSSLLCVSHVWPFVFPFPEMTARTFCYDHHFVSFDLYIDASLASMNHRAPRIVHPLSTRKPPPSSRKISGQAAIFDLGIIGVSRRSQ